VITEIASQLLINGKLVSNSPLYYSLSTWATVMSRSIIVLPGV
jgi:hypothetical protein